MDGEVDCSKFKTGAMRINACNRCISTKILSEYLLPDVVKGALNLLNERYHCID
jgi:hypothetical protein